jgi:drug/metabolite transporter (DMT)-like permease
MNLDRRVLGALTSAGLLWGTTVPLSKVALGWLAPGWLTVTRFGLAGVVLLVIARRQVRGALTLPVLAAGVLGYGGSVLIQSAGIARTSVSHAALLIGATPVLVAVIAAVWRRSVATPLAWAGFAVSLLGVGLVTAGHGGGASAVGDGLVLASLLSSAGMTVAQARLLRGRDPVAVTAVQFLGAAVVLVPFAAATEGVPATIGHPGTVLAVAALVAGGTIAPFTLFAYAQSKVRPEVAGAFLNLEPLVGALAGVLAFGDPATAVQLVGGAAILAGIALSGLPALRHRPPARPGRPTGRTSTAPPMMMMRCSTWPSRTVAAVEESLAQMTTGEFSQRSRLSMKALRPYERDGLLRPAVVDPGAAARRSAELCATNLRLSPRCVTIAGSVR